MPSALSKLSPVERETGKEKNEKDELEQRERQKEAKIEKDKEIEDIL